MKTKLYKALSFAGSPIFGFYTPNYSAYDNQIVSATIHRGSNSSTGYTPSTLEIETANANVQNINGLIGRFFIRDVPAQRIASRLGVSPESITSRFYGRMATTEVTDISDARRTTTMTGSSWLTQMAYSQKTTSPVAGQTIPRIISESLGLLDGRTPRGITAKFYGTFDTVAVTEKPMTWRDLFSRYVESTGIIVRETRKGESQFMPLSYAHSFAQNLLTLAVPVGRHQAISPAKWVMKNERPPSNQRYTITNENGNVVTRQFDSTSTTGEIVETNYNDWSHIREGSSQASDYARKLIYQGSTYLFTVPSIKADILLLLRLGDPYSLKLAGYLLSLETYEPIGFTGDWPSGLRGWHIATGITETITAEKWEIEISLSPWVQAFGIKNSETPKPMIWNQVKGTWEENIGTWDSYDKGGK